MGKQNFCIVEEVRVCTAKTASTWRQCKFYRALSDNGCKHKDGNSCMNPSAWKDYHEKARAFVYSQTKLTA